MRSLVLPAASLLALTAVGQIPSRRASLQSPPVPLDATLSGWPGYGRDPSHQANAAVATQDLNRILWSTPVDLAPQYNGNDLLIHYGTPLITGGGTVVVTVKVGPTSGFRTEGREPRTGSLLWTEPTDYQLPPHNWTPSCACTLTVANELVMPASGGTVLIRSAPDQAGGAVRRVAFYGLAAYQANPAAYDQNLCIDTPITADRKGNLYFGFVALGPTPLNLVSGIARISAAGVGTWVTAATAANDANIRKVVYNCAPALSLDGGSIYVAVNDQPTSGFGAGYLLKLDSATLAQQGRVRLRDVAASGNDAILPDDGTASPMVGPDGDVFFGVLENPFGANHLRGWLLHFDGSLTQARTGGPFGWDDTPSVVPAAAVPSYHGASSYLVLTKYNNYGGGGGNGLNKLGVFDPNATMTDPISGATVMNEILSVLGPTPDPQYPGGVREWCINTAAIDVQRRSAIVNNEDGKLYRWDFTTNTLVQPVTLTAGIGEAYTPTIAGPDGLVYAINNARLYAVGR